MNGTIGNLRVPGATLFYRVEGSGPVLLVLQGGAADADGSNALSRQLADRHAVVSCDRRGLSRSRVDDPDAPVAIATHADDASRLLAALGGEPATVLGVSIGALIGLDLVARHPDQVGLLVAHEPPAAEVLEPGDRERLRRMQEELEETHRASGAAAAMLQFIVKLGVRGGDREPDLEVAPPSPHTIANLERFAAFDAPAVRTYPIDLPALAAARDRIVLTVGKTSRDRLHALPARALAERLGAPLVELPGGHGGFDSHPKAFAAELRDLIASRAAAP